MKYLLFIFAALLVLNTTQALAANLICIDNFTKEFPGTLFVVTKSNDIKNVYYAENSVKKQQPHYIQVQSFLADSGNKYARGGGSYQLAVQTPQGLLQGKLTVNTAGDEMKFHTNEGSFILSCE